MLSLAERIRQQEEEKRKSLSDRIREASSPAPLKVTTAQPGTITSVKTADPSPPILINRGPLVGPVKPAPKINVLPTTAAPKPLMVAPLPVQPKLNQTTNYNLPGAYAPSSPLPAEPFQPGQGFNQQQPNYANQTTGQVVGVDNLPAPTYKAPEGRFAKFLKPIESFLDMRQNRLSDIINTYSEGYKVANQNPTFAKLADKSQIPQFLEGYLADPEKQYQLSQGQDTKGFAAALALGSLPGTAWEDDAFRAISKTYKLSLQESKRLYTIAKEVNTVEDFIKFAKIKGFTANESARIFDIAKQAKVIKVSNVAEDVAKTAARTANDVQPTRVVGELVQDTPQTLKTAPQATKTLESPLTTEARKFNTTVNIQDKNDIDYLRRIFSEDTINDIKAGKKTNWRGQSYEELGKVNIISETPKTANQKLEGRIKPYKLEQSTVFHGTSPDNLPDITTKGFKVGSELPDDAFRGGGYDAKQNSISFSTDPQIAANFTGTGSRGALIEVKLKPGANVVTVKGIDYAEDLNDFVKQLRKDGVDAVYLPGEKEVAVINKKVIGDIVNSKEFDVFDRKNQLADFGRTTPKENPLLSEARKYKSAEEFVKAQGETVYHGSPNEIIGNLKSSKELGTSQHTSKFGGVFFSKDKAVADAYSRLPNRANLAKINRPEVSNYVKKLQSKITEYNESVDDLYKGFEKQGWIVDDNFERYVLAENGGKKLQDKVVKIQREIRDIKENTPKLTVTEKELLFGKANTQELTLVGDVVDINKRVGFSENREALIEKYKGKIIKLRDGNNQIEYIATDPSQIKTKSQLTDIYNKAHAGSKVDPLIAEAKKFKSAEEFVKSKGEPVYHGTKKEFDKFESGNLGARGIGEQTNGFFFSPQKQVGKNFAGKDGKVIEAYLDIKNPKIAKDYKEIATINKEYIDNAIKEGYDGAYFKPSQKDIDSGYYSSMNEEWVAFKPEQIKTKSQLTDIWKEANKAPKAPPVKLEDKIATKQDALAKVEYKKESLNQEFPDDVLEKQYNSFKKLVPLSVINKAEDVAQLKARFKADPNQLDNVLYSQDLTNDEVFDMFKDRRFTGLENRTVKSKLTGESSVIKRDLTKLESIAKTREKINNRLLNTALNAEVKGIKLGVKIGSKVTKDALVTKFKQSATEIEELRKGIVEYIKEFLPETAQGKFIQSVKNATTKKQAVSIFSRVDELADTIQKKEVVGDIKDSLDTKGLPVDYQKKITELTENLDFQNPTSKTKSKLDSLQKYLQENAELAHLHPELLKRVDRLNKIPIKSMTTSELKELKETLETIKSQGQLKLALKNKYNQRVREANVNRMIDSTNNLDAGGKKRNDAKSMYINTMNTARVADMIDGFKAYQGENTKLIKSFNDGETTAFQNTKALTGSALEEIQNLGIKELTEDQQIRIMINIRDKEGAFDQVETLLNKYGYPDVPKLTPQEEEVINILEKYTNQFVDDIANVYEEIENVPFDKLDRYILPIKYEDEVNTIPSETITQGGRRTTKVEKGFTKSRVKGVQRTPRIDVLGVFEEAINDQQWYLNLQPRLEDAKYVVLNKRFQEHSGQLVSTFWRNYLDVVSRRGWAANAKSSPLLRQARLNLSTAILGYKLSSIIMQPMAVFDAMAFAQSNYGGLAALDVLREFTKSWVIPGKSKQLIADSARLQQRTGGEVAIADLGDSIGRGKSAWDRFKKHSMTLLQKGDTKTAAGVQEGVARILEKRGIENAKAESEFIMNLVSSSSEITSRPLILSNGEGARTLFTFMTFALNRFGLITQDLIRGGVLKEGWRKKLNAIIGLGILVAGIIAEQEARDFLTEKVAGKEPKDKGSLLKQALLSIPSQIPYFGSLAQYGSADPPLVSTVKNVVSGTKSAIQGKEKKTKVKGLIKAGESVSSIFGIPGTSQASDILERILTSDGEDSSLDFSGGQLDFSGSELDFSSSNLDFGKQ